MTAQLKEQIKKLPTESGIYLFKNSKNRSLYIGKALNLRNRAKSYLKTSNPRLQQMILETKKVDFIETGGDIEALILESQYIKKYQPPFNIMLRDDKQYAFVVFGEDEYPKIFITHQPEKDIVSSKYHVVRNDNKLKNHTTYYKLHTTDSYIGPFTEVGALKTTLRLLRRIFPYCTCTQTHHNYCLNYHIGKCPGFCCLKQQNQNLKLKNQNAKFYEKNIQHIKSILSGKKSSVTKNLEKEMKTLSKKQKYEKAQELQYKIKKIKRVFENARIIQDLPPFMIYHKDSQTMDFLQTLLNLRTPLRRIECYDIANIQGKHAVGAMVVFTNGQPDKNEYRKFKIYTKQTSDDTGMLKEVLTRRFNHSEWPYPDLIIIDGGKGQLSASLKAVSNFQFPISKKLEIIALTKNEKHMGYKIITENGKEISLSKLPLNTKNFLLQIDSEAHRFAISYYRQLHRKSIK